MKSDAFILSLPPFLFIPPSFTLAAWLFPTLIFTYCNLHAGFIVTCLAGFIVTFLAGFIVTCLAGCIVTGLAGFIVTCLARFIVTCLAGSL